MKCVSIRSAQAHDAAAIAALHVASWRDAYASILDPEYLTDAVELEKRAHWAHMIASNQIIEVAETDAAQLVGFVCGLPDIDPERGSRVDNLHVLPVFRGGGIGERLLRQAASILQCVASRKDMHVWVFEENTAAIRFYLRVGGEVIGRDFSRIPAAGGKPIVCIHWADMASLSLAG